MFQIHYVSNPQCCTYSTSSPVTQIFTSCFSADLGGSPRLVATGGVALHHCAQPLQPRLLPHLASRQVLPPPVT